MPAALHLRLDYDRCVNYAMQQNDVPLVKAVQVTNASDETLCDLAISFQAGPSLSNLATIPIAELGPGASFNIPRVDLHLRPEQLVNQLEHERGTLRVCVERAGELLLVEEHPLELLAYNEWSGSSLPEILAAFVLPNHPALNALLAAARARLGERTGDPSLNGYQSRSESRVRAFVTAVYDGARSFQIAYVSPPASFELHGQKIRLPEQVLGQRLGTCLDLATLLAGALEQIGLHPLLVLHEGHALVGAWLREDTFPEPVLHDPVRLRKRVDLGEIVLLEPTGVCAPEGMTFERACEAARARLDDEARFVYAIDVRAARRARIRPLPARAEGSFEVVLTEAPEAPVPAAPPAPAPAPAPPVSEPAPDSGPSRLERWQHRLLDLSLRNRLLNFTITQRTIPLLAPELAPLEDALQSGEAFALLEQPRMLRAQDPRELSAEDGNAFLREELAARRLHADLPAADLDRRLLELFRAARTSREEGGANTLFLALGFVRWFEAKSSERALLAPILLLPIELERKSVSTPFRVVLADEDARINVTLLQKLSVDFAVATTGLDEVVEDERGIDVRAVLQRFRAALRDVGRFEVVERAVLGMFSFTKFLMWRDLEARAQELLGNPIVRHLAETPNAPFAPNVQVPEIEVADDARDPAKSFGPLDADSSQLAAVDAAAAGQSFVLEGPPGTGKSQTIANLIAQCLAEGKRVLFVSEKAAALDVVYRRLASVGLEPFCLELHSNRAAKRDVVRQLGAALEAARGEPPATWEEHAAELQAVRSQLNAHARKLHDRTPIGRSLFEVVATLVGLRGAERCELALDVGSVDAKRLVAIRQALEALHAAGEPLGSIATHPLRAVGHDDWQPSWPRLIESYAPLLAQAARQLEERLAELNLGPLPEAEQLAPLLLDASGAPAALLLEPDWSARKQQIAEWIAIGRRRDARRSELFARWEPRILTLDLHALRSHWERRSAWVAPLRWFLLRGARAVLNALQKTPRNLAETLADLRLGEELQQDEAALIAIAPLARRWLGPLWRNGAPDWGELEHTLAWAEKLRAIPNLERNAALASNRAALAGDTPLGNKLRRFVATRGEFAQALERLSWLKLDVALAFGPRADPQHLAHVRAVAETMARRAPALRDWCAYLRARRVVEQLQIPELAAAHSSGQLTGEALVPAFERSFLERWLEARLAGDAELRAFQGETHGRLIRRFRALDQEALRLAAEVVRARLAAKAPQAGAQGGETSEVGLLLRELKKQRRHLPPRQLFQRIPNLLPRLKPCFLMSPLSVAQYLDPALAPFDLVVFDEASQIPVWDAIGAIARGAQLVCVGDSRQLPPTTFFQKLEEEGQVDLEDVADLESILDECAAAGLPRRALRWHYRSRHESLIAFSNHHYYENRLITFPSPDARSPQSQPAAGVRLVPVAPGGYERGKDQTHRHEAELVVAEVVRRLQDPLLRERSLGIVTFSVAQQTLIEDLLERAIAQHPELEAAFAHPREPLFVKNLENVQGDERDVMLFSICYGPDAAGRVTMNFGPLNKHGGERRLNVAVTRAREELLVFSSLQPDQIDLARTQALGVRHLKSFLDYAARGPSAIAEGTRTQATRTASPFELGLQAALERRGWTVHAQVGCAGYRIDLAIVDPQNRDRYLLGIEGDGETYGAAKTARDRDRLRALVLANLGWRLHRVWSLDYWIDPEKELEKLSRALVEAKQSRPAVPLARVATAAAPVVAPASAAAPAPASAVIAPSPTEPDAAPPPAEPTALAAAPSSPGEHYPLIPRPVPVGDADSFHAARSTDSIAARLHEVLAREAPITLNLLTRRLAEAFGITRVTERVRARVREVCATAGVRPDDELVLWRADQDPQRWLTFRPPAPEDPDARNAEDLPAIELANATAAILAQHIAMPMPALCQKLARVFGIARVGNAVRVRLEAGVRALARRGGAKVEGEQVSLPG